MKLNKKITTRLKQCMEENGINQSELAEKANYTPQYISFIITGKKPLTESAANRFAEIFHVLPNYLLCKVDYKTEIERRENNIKESEEDSRAIKRLLEMHGIYLSKVLLYSGDNAYSIDPISICTPRIKSKKFFLGTQNINNQNVTITEIKIFFFTEANEERELDADLYFFTLQELIEYSEFISRRLLRKSFLKEKGITE